MDGPPDKKSWKLGDRGLGLGFNRWQIGIGLLGGGLLKSISVQRGVVL